jgi:transposase
LYKGLLRFNKLKEKAEKITFEYAKKYLSFDFSLVFFDITTLYFETFKEDEEKFMRPGFSKDGKPAQPQILVSLVVTKEGYPIAMDVFSGNTFEGHTIIPVIERFKNTHKVEDLTVVADAGMLSFDNIQKLVSKNIKYIVGARVSNLPLKLIKDLSLVLNKTEGIYFQVETDKGLLICDYSIKRANKNKSDRKKQIQKALNQINSNYKQNKRLRFVKETSKTTSILNQELIEKDELLEGIKGYYTNLRTQTPALIISRYKDLWHVEKAFRIAKSDLLARPIYHFKKESIKAHILIVFLSLCLSKAIELKNNKSIKTVKDMILSVPDITLKDNITNQTYTKKLKNNYNQEIIKQLQY